MKEIKSEILAIQIASFRLFGINKESSIKAMNELSKRKKEGSEFNFESYIKDIIDKAPKPDNVDSLFSNIISMFDRKSL